jgi:hypothetical protein
MGLLHDRVSTTERTCLNIKQIHSLLLLTFGQVHAFIKSCLCVWCIYTHTLCLLFPSKGMTSSSSTVSALMLIVWRVLTNTQVSWCWRPFSCRVSTGKHPSRVPDLATQRVLSVCFATLSSKTPLLQGECLLRTKASSCEDGSSTPFTAAVELRLNEEVPPASIFCPSE